MTSVIGVILVGIICCVAFICTCVDEDRRYQLLFTGRVYVTYDEWYTRHYAKSDIEFHSVEVALDLLSRVLGVQATLLEPQDNIAEMFDDFDVLQFQRRLTRELGIPTSDTPEIMTIEDVILLIDQAG